MKRDILNLNVKTFIAWKAVSRVEAMTLTVASDFVN